MTLIVVKKNKKIFWIIKICRCHFEWIKNSILYDPFASLRFISFLISSYFSIHRMGNELTIKCHIVGIFWSSLWRPHTHVKQFCFHFHSSVILLSFHFELDFFSLISTTTITTNNDPNNNFEFLEIKLSQILSILRNRFPIINVIIVFVKQTSKKNNQLINQSIDDPDNQS